ncbi:MAG TPA: Holliday junction resolvase RuvX [Thermodesulfobacteriota bacterium]|nr:Holliday junction resolvase RuvX [Thermodesulfobacteriota bacterium]
MKILGLDLGSKTIGVALSDDLLLTAQVLTSIKRTVLEKDLAAILALVKEYQVEEIVIGLPVNMDGTKGGAAIMTESFIENLRQATPVKITPWDERLSTVAAEKILLEGDLSRQKRRKVIDRLAAAFILQGYLDSRPKEGRNLF